MTESEKATKRQLWYLHILTKTDTRELQITKAEANIRIRALLKSGTMVKPKPIEPMAEAVCAPLPVASVPSEPLPEQPHVRKCPKCNLPMYHGIQSSILGSTFGCCPDCAVPFVKDLEKTAESNHHKPVMDGTKSYHGKGFGELGVFEISPEAHLWLSGHYTKYLDGRIPEQGIEITCDNQPVVSLNGNYSKGAIKEAMSHYCKPGEGKIRLVKVR